MIETLTALLFAHVLADFVCQPSWIVDRNRSRGIPAHIAIVGVTAALATGHLGLWIFALMAAHFVVDLIKTFLLQKRLWSYLADQAAHVAVLVALASVLPDLWGKGYWVGLPQLNSAMAVAAGLIFATRGGQFAVEYLLEEWLGDARPLALAPTAPLIGLLERGIIFTLALVGELSAIGFLIAAKAIFQFSGDQTALEARGFVIAGTFASFAWALAVGLGVVEWIAIQQEATLESLRQNP